MTTKTVQKRQAIERRIVLAACKELLNQELVLSIDNGGDEDELSKSSNLSEISRHIMLTDEETIRVITADGFSVGWMKFVYGNDGWDVLCDYSVTLDQYIPETQALIEKLSD